MELLNNALDLCAMIPDSIALVGFAVGVVGSCIAMGGRPAAPLVATDADHWAAEEPATYRDAA